jgi:predicted aspartyl protease
MFYSYYKNLQGQYFPVIPLTVLNEKLQKFDLTALIDSGATTSVFNVDLAEQLNLKIEQGKEIFLGGVGGRIKGYIHELKTEVSGKTFKLPVVFSREYKVSFNLLGRDAFFPNFRITFDEKVKTVELV